MADYKLSFKASVEKDLSKVPASVSHLILKKIEQLQAHPLSSRSVKLTGSSDHFRIRSGDYRIVYSVDHQNHEILIHYVRHRRDVYRFL